MNINSRSSACKAINSNLNLKDARIIHFIGIGGIGMSALARILNSKGHIVQGSDTNSTPLTKELEKEGIKVFYGHNASNLTGVDLIVRSSAIKDNNPEISDSIPVLSRADMLLEIVKSYYSIAIAGAHGKTTTTGLIGELLISAKKDPLVINGGIMNRFKTNAIIGNGEIAVFESDESDGSFLKTNAAIKIVTNIDAEHLEFYGNFANLQKAYREFINRPLRKLASGREVIGNLGAEDRDVLNVHEDLSTKLTKQFSSEVEFSKRSNDLLGHGFAILCLDDPILSEMANDVNREQLITYSIKSPSVDLFASNIDWTERGSSFDLSISDKFSKIDKIGNINISAFGLHNVQNSLAAIAVGLLLKIEVDVIKSSLANFSGIKRRFTETGEVNGIKIIDDYAHHPEEIQATMKVARKLADQRGGKLFVVLQPHRYSRLRNLFDKFIMSLDLADHILVTAVYAAGEEHDVMFNSKKLVEKLNQRSKSCAEYLDKEETLSYIIGEACHSGDIVLCLGAGNITYLAQSLPIALKNRFT